MTYDERIETTEQRLSEHLGYKVKAIHQYRTRKYDEIFYNTKTSRFLDHQNEILKGKKSIGLVVQPYGRKNEYENAIKIIEEYGFTVTLLGKGWWNDNTFAYLISN